MCEPHTLCALYTTRRYLIHQQNETTQESLRKMAEATVQQEKNSSAQPQQPFSNV